MRTAIVAFIIFACGCCGAKKQAVMPSAYIEDVSVSRLHDGEELYLPPAALAIDDESKVWLWDYATKIADPEPTSKFLKVFKQDGKFLVIACNIKSFKRTPQALIEGRVAVGLGRAAVGLFKVTKLIVKTSVTDLAGLKFDDDGQELARRSL